MSTCTTCGGTGGCHICRGDSPSWYIQRCSECDSTGVCRDCQGDGST